MVFSECKKGEAAVLYQNFFLALLLLRLPIRMKVDFGAKNKAYAYAIGDFDSICFWRLRHSPLAGRAYSDGHSRGHFARSHLCRDDPAALNDRPRRNVQWRARRRC